MRKMINFVTAKWKNSNDMVLHNSLFRSGTIYDVPDIIGLIERRIEWMDCNGIIQWNKSHFRERYPGGDYIQAAE